MMLTLITLSQTPPQQTGSNTVWLTWALILIAMAAALFFVELLVPAGGAIGFLAAVCLIAGIVMLFGVDTNLGLLATAVSLATLPVLFFFAIKVWPHTPVAQWLTLGDSQTEDDTDPPLSDPAKVEGLPAPGMRGEAVSELRPVGTCRIDGERHECLAVGGVIEPGEAIEVVVVDGTQIKVRRVGQG